MNQLSLYRCLDIKEPAVISFIGGGGKTTLIRRLAGEMTACGRKVLITTTTKFYPFADLPHFYLDNSADIRKNLSLQYKNINIAVLGSHICSDGKIAGISPQLPGLLSRDLCINVLVEADGSKGRPLKGYDKYEPVLPPDTDLVIPIIGAEALDTPVDKKSVHRVEIFQKALRLSDSPVRVDEKLLARTFLYMEQEALKQTSHARFIYVINKHDLLDNPGRAYKIAGNLNVHNNKTPLLSTEAKSEHPVKMFLNAPGQKEIATLTCVILAAGRSARMGKTDKLTLPFKHSTVLQSTLEQVKKSCVSEIVVVTTPDSRWKKLLTGEKVRVVENALYKSGQASSLKAGLAEVNPQTQAVIFALGDQPLIGSDIFRSLIDRYEAKLKPVIYPVYKGRRGNPVIFDRTLWPLLMKIEGDEGGRAIITNLTSEDVEVVHIKDKCIITDIDTHEDYQAALRMNDPEL
jgi:molybdenum cofactor cytidylyltransferase